MFGDQVLVEKVAGEEEGGFNQDAYFFLQLMYFGWVFLVDHIFIILLILNRLIHRWPQHKRLILHQRLHLHLLLQ